MKFFRHTFFAAWVCLLLCASLTNAAAKDEWVRVRSKNFQLVGNAAENDIRGVAAKLEQFREVFLHIFSKFNFSSPIPTNVVVFRDEKSFRDFKPVSDGERKDWIAGFFQSGEDENYIVISTEGEKTNAYRTIFHEYVHFLLNNDLGRANAPPWFNEGLAEYYATFQIENDQKITLGAINKSHLQLLQKSKLLPLEAFFGVDNYTLQRQGSDGAGIFYAEAWALMHYLLQSGDGARNQQQLDKFVDLVLSGKNPKDAFSETFHIDYATMESELKKYVAQKNYQTTVINSKEKFVFDNEMQSSPVSESEAKIVLGDLLLHMNRLPEATALLEEALKMDANSGAANSTLGLVKLRQRNLPEAEKYLEKAVALDDRNYLTFYRYAYVLSRKGMTDFGFVSDYEAERAEKMREALKKAICLNPNFAESYNLYAFINVVRNEEIDEAIDYVNRALKLAPGNQWYLIRAAELYARKEDFTNARKIAQKVFAAAPDDDLRVYAQNTINNINFYEAQLDSVKRYKEIAPPNDVSDQPLSEEELARLNEKALLESINRNLRKPKTGELRVLGLLTKIECHDNDVFYSVKADKQNFLFRSENFDSLFLMSYDRDLADDEVGCGTIKKEHSAVIIFRQPGNSNAKSVGEIVSIEFVPKNFKFIQ